MAGFLHQVARSGARPVPSRIGPRIRRADAPRPGAEASDAAASREADAPREGANAPSLSAATSAANEQSGHVAPTPGAAHDVAPLGPLMPSRPAAPPLITQAPPAAHDLDIDSPLPVEPPLGPLSGPPRVRASAAPEQAIAMSPTGLRRATPFTRLPTLFDEAERSRVDHVRREPDPSAVETAAPVPAGHDLPGTASRRTSGFPRLPRLDADAEPAPAPRAPVATPPLRRSMPLPELGVTPNHPHPGSLPEGEGIRAPEQCSARPPSQLPSPLTALPANDTARERFDSLSASRGEGWGEGSEAAARGRVEAQPVVMPMDAGPRLLPLAAPPSHASAPAAPGLTIQSLEVQIVERPREPPPEPAPVMTPAPAAPPTWDWPDRRHLGHPW